jgi:uncharacterized alpha-E superfamily protein
MLSRTASSLYWIGRYVERAEFLARLMEATIRLDALSPRTDGPGAWDSALTVASADHDFDLTGETRSPLAISRYLTLSSSNPSSIRSCLDAARSNAKSVRTALSRDAWEAINRAWLGLRGRATTGNSQTTLNIIESIRAETRGFEGALHRMLRNEAYSFISLGAAIERADNTARLIDVKYHLLLPEGDRVGGQLDRDQWTTILHTVSAVTAYRWLYSEGLKPWLVAELLCLKRELPRSLAASADEAITHLNSIGKRTGLQGEADRLARLRHNAIDRTTIDTIFAKGLHEWLIAFIDENARIHQAIGSQFRFG